MTAKPIQTLKIEHCQRMEEIHQQAFEKGFWTREAFEKILSNPRTIAIGSFHGDALTGFLLAQSIFDEIEILTLAIAPQNQGRGIANYLMEILLSKASEQAAKTIFLEVHCDNQRAINLYQKFRFLKTGERPNYYKSSKGISGPAFLFKKELP